MFRKYSRILALAALAVPAAPGALRAQMPVAETSDINRAQVSRQQLQALLESYQQGSQSPAYSVAYRARSRGQMALIKERLENGDLQVGDKVQLVVEGQAPLTNTFTVDPGRVLVLPGIGAIPLAGVLRSELEAHLTKEVGRFVVQPIVHAQSLIRITILGAVGKPGFYVVPASSLVPDAIMTAGGPASNVDMRKLRITRSGSTIWDGATLQKAVTEGWTLDQLSLRAGDVIELPAPSGTSKLGLLRPIIISIGPVMVLLRALKII